VNDSMKRPPMQQDAERLAAQGRFGDTMLVHMNPKEVQGIASLMPGGRLTTNPITGQPEAFLVAALTALTAAKGAYDAFKKPKVSGETKQRRRSQSAVDQYTQDVLSGVRGSQAFQPPKTLGELDASQVGFLPKGVGGFNLGYQGMPGQMYANYQTPEKFGQAIQAFGAPAGVASLPSAPVNESITTTDTGKDKEDKSTDGFAVNQDKVLETINNQREKAGLPPFDTYQDFLNSINESLPFDIRMPMMGPGTIEIPRIGGLGSFDEASIGVGFADGGIAMLSNGGEMDFPRMNGPISGPGTETSDDIPAMLSDGEFVVNAKAVRGIGKIGGANKSKADQRKEGARMMYALQRAGEKAMRGAS